MTVKIFLSALAATAFLSAEALSKEDMEKFLKSAKVTKTQDIAKGITNSRRLTLTDGQLTHDAHLQSIDQAMAEFRGNRGTELNFKDSWKFNVAAYRLAEMLGIEHMVPMSVERQVGGNSSSVTWWVDNVLMDEAKRVKDKISPPDVQGWNEQMWVLRVFDQLIYNTDRNLGNMLITKDWEVRMIDHTRAFRLMRTLQSEKSVEKCDRALLAKLKQLDEASLTARLSPYLNREEIRAMVARRDLIVKKIEGMGEAGLYNLKR
jgi:hypothetical protein